MNKLFFNDIQVPWEFKRNWMFIGKKSVVVSYPQMIGVMDRTSHGFSNPGLIIWDYLFGKWGE